jgi:hypothetical protein
LLLPTGAKVSAPEPAPLLAMLVCGVIIGWALRHWSAQDPPRLTALGLGAIFFLGGAAVVEAAKGYDATVLRATLLLFLGALAFEATRAELKRLNLPENPTPSWRRRPLWLVAGIILAFAVPALLGDAAPARSGLALCLGAGALAAAYIALEAMRKGDALEITSWSGGLGGGRAGFRFSRTIGLLLLSIALAGTAAAMLVQRPASSNSKEEKPPASNAVSEARKPPGSAPGEKD